jgi:hypothetical protein
LERAGLDDLVVLGFRFFSTLLGVRVASFTAAALRTVGHCCCVVSLAPRWVLLFFAQRCVFSRGSLLGTRARLARGGDDHFF